MPGNDRGRMIRIKEDSVPHPSISAASSKVGEMPSKKPFIIHVEKGMVIAVLASTTERKELINPIFINMMYNGTINNVAGIMQTNSREYPISRFQRERKRDKLYAARELTTTTSRMVRTVTRMEFENHLTSGRSVKILEYELKVMASRGGNSPFLLRIWLRSVIDVISSQ